MRRERAAARPHTERLDIDHATNNAPPPRRPSNTQQGPSYLWNGTWQQLIPVLLDDDDPNYRENRKMISETIRRWDEGKP